MLRINSISASYGKAFRLSDINLQISHGEICAIIGPNGAGKSTLLKAVGGLLQIQSGEIAYLGNSLDNLSSEERARLLAFIPQARIIGGAFTVEQTVMLGRTIHMNWLGKASQKDFAIVRWAMEATQIDHLAKRRNAELSGGELQRALLARAIAQATPILLMDEPTNHLDIKHQVAFLSLVEELARKENKIILMALHDLNLVSKFADKVALLVDGKIRVLGEPEKVLSSEIVSHSYDTPIDVIKNPRDGKPLLFPGVGNNK